MIHRTAHQYQHGELLRCLKQIEREEPPDVDIHFIADDYSPPSTPR